VGRRSTGQGIYAIIVFVQQVIKGNIKSFDVYITKVEHIVVPEILVTWQQQKYGILLAQYGHPSSQTVIGCCGECVSEFCVAIYGSTPKYSAPHPPQQINLIGEQIS
jgi:hypothetical protein